MTQEPITRRRGEEWLRATSRVLSERGAQHRLTGERTLLRMQTLTLRRALSPSCNKPKGACYGRDKPR